jgi:hypothetical protein
MAGRQKPDATRVAGFRAWLNLDDCVKRGERALRIWVPMAPSRAAQGARTHGSDAQTRR